MIKYFQKNPTTNKPIVRKPYAIKATPCGFQGSYLRLAKAFIENPDGLNVTLYGDLNKILAVEWAKFRWGVFDDSPAPNSGRDFYATQAFVEASKCSLEIKGKALLREKTGNQEPVLVLSFYKVL